MVFLDLALAILTKVVLYSRSRRLLLFFKLANTHDLVRPEREKTFFENAKLQLKLPLFAAILKQNASGSYDFGFIDEFKYIGELNYVDVDSSRGHWSFNASGYDLGDGEVINDPLESVIGNVSLFLYSKWVSTTYRIAG
jgi:hypothetical protein